MFDERLKEISVIVALYQELNRLLWVSARLTDLQVMPHGHIEHFVLISNAMIFAPVYFKAIQAQIPGNGLPGRRNALEAVGSGKYLHIECLATCSTTCQIVVSKE